MSAIKPPAFAPEERSSFVRYGVLAWMCSLAFVLYLDRVCFGQAEKAIRTALDLTMQQTGWAGSAFLLAYGLFEAPTGRWGDRYGSRGVLTRIVVWWSLFTALTGVVTGIFTLVAVRFLFGAGEAGAYPNIARVLARWFPDKERNRAQGIMLACSLLGGAAAPAAAGYLIQGMGWRWTFVLFGSLGVVWAAGFYWAFRDDPDEHPRVNAAERRIIAADERAAPLGAEHPPIPWKHVFASRNVWLLGWIQSCGAFCSYMFMFWYPTYLQDGRGVDPITTGWLASLVVAGGAVGCLGGGFANQWLIRITSNRRDTWRWFGAGSLALAAVAVCISGLMESPVVSCLLASATFMGVQAQQAPWWGVTTAISGPHLGTLFGLMNSLGVPGGIISTSFLGTFAERMQELGFTGRACWDPAFYIYALVLLAGAVAWLFVNADKPVVPDEEVVASS